MAFAIQRRKATKARAVFGADTLRFGAFRCAGQEERHAWRRSEHGDQQTDPTPPLHAARYTGRHALEWVVAFPRMRNDKRRPRTCNQTVMSGPACSKVSENTDVFRDEA